MALTQGQRFSNGLAKVDLDVMLLTREDKRSLGNMHLVEGHDSAWVSWNYGIKPDTLRKWIHIVRQYIFYHDDCVGSRLLSAASPAEFCLV